MEGNVLCSPSSPRVRYLPAVTSHTRVEFHAGAPIVRFRCRGGLRISLVPFDVLSSWMHVRTKGRKGGRLLALDQARLRFLSRCLVSKAELRALQKEVREKVRKSKETARPSFRAPRSRRNLAELGRDSLFRPHMKNSSSCIFVSGCRNGKHLFVQGSGFHAE